MRRLARGLGWTAVVVAVLLGFMGVASLPSGGLMFALPFVFLIPAAFFGAVGAGLLWLGRTTGETDR